MILSRRLTLLLPLIFALSASALFAQARAQSANSHLVFTINADGSYSIATPNVQPPVLRAHVGAQVDGVWLRSDRYPQHQVARSQFHDELGSGEQLQVTHTGLNGVPALVTTIRVYQTATLGAQAERHTNALEPPSYNDAETALPAQPWFGDVQVEVRNTTNRAIKVQAIRTAEVVGATLINLGGPASADRILSDSYSEDRPEMAIFDFGKAENQMHRAVGSQLIYNRQSGRDLFIATLTSDRFLTIFHLKAADAAGTSATSYTIDSTGTTEIQKGESLREAPPADQIPLSLPVAPGASLASERTAFTTGNDYLAQLQNYGRAIRQLRHARVAAPPLIGWWSWTAFYAGLSEGTAITNAEWLSEHLRLLGYKYFHIDEGYQFARGEYTTPNANLFPHGLEPVYERATRLGLVPAIWTAPFEVAGRAWVHEHHPEWLVHNAQGTPIQINWVGQGADRDALYALDPTHPGAQEYLRQTYRTLADDWGVRYIKMDFMDDSAIEGEHYRPNTTALEAQQIGLRIIRQTVGDRVLLDKDGSPMLNPVGYVDTGRISLDTGHSFRASKEAAPGIAARFYMNRNWFLDDPDAFSVAGQIIPDQTWHQSSKPISLDDAEVSIALAAVSASMYEIGDDLPTLGAEADRVPLVTNRDLLDMVELGRAALPLDLMTYRPDDLQPSVFWLREDARQSILTVFNWSEHPSSHTFRLSDLQLPPNGNYQASDVLRPANSVAISGGQLTLTNQSPHSVRVIKIIDANIPAAAPDVRIEAPSQAQVGQEITLRAAAANTGAPALRYHWEFGDGTGEEGRSVTHAYTRNGNMQVRLTVEGLDRQSAIKTATIAVTGTIPTTLRPQQNRRLQ